MESLLDFGGRVGMRLIRVPKPSLAWQAKQWIRKDRILGLLSVALAHLTRKFTGFPVVYGKLSAVYVNGETGEKINFGIISRRLVTDAFVAFMVDQLQAETSEWGDFKFHDSGVGVTAADNNDTDIETTDGEARVAGTQIEGASAWIYKSVATITYTTTKAITEHGLFSIITGGTMMDRHVFTAINVVNTDSIEFTYELTVVAET